MATTNPPPHLPPSDPLAAFRAYVAGVTTGEIVSADCVRLAVERHSRDLVDGPARGLRFDESEAARACSFFPSLLVHSKGEWSGQPLELAPWQAFCVGSLFGWRRADGSRRFRTGYIEVARKNGKSTLSAGIGLYMLIADREPGAEVYSAATTREQAKIVWLEAKRMVKSSPHLSRRLRSFASSLVFENGSFQPLSSDYNKLDGLNVHGAIADEVHAWPNRDLWDVLETGTGSRRQPLLVAITTAGSELTSFCGSQHEYSEAVVRTTIEDDGLFAFVASPGRNEDWTLEATWQKANPNLGVSVKRDSLVEQCARATADPAAQNAFRRLRLNQWVSAGDRYIDLGRWDRCEGTLSPAELELSREGASGYAALDLAATTDLAALVIALEPEDPGDPYDLIVRAFMPEARAFDPNASRLDGVPYSAWVERGWIIATPGEVIDYGFIRAELERLSERFSLRDIAFDPWNAAAFVHELETDLGFSMVQMRQGYATMGDPTRRLLDLMLMGKLRHAGHPVLRWAADNLVIMEDPAGNRKPDRKRSRGRIDPIVAAIMAIDRVLRNEGGPTRSRYDDPMRGILSL